MNDKNQIDILRQAQETIFNNLKVASIGKVIGELVNGYRVELIPKVEERVVIVETVNKIFEPQPTEKSQKLPDLLGRYVLVLFLDNYTHAVGNGKLNVNDYRSKHSYSNAFALQFIDRWVGDGKDI